MLLLTLTYSCGFNTFGMTLPLWQTVNTICLNVIIDMRKCLKLFQCCRLKWYKYMCVWGFACALRLDNICVLDVYEWTFHFKDGINWIANCSVSACCWTKLTYTDTCVFRNVTGMFWRQNQTNSHTALWTPSRTYKLENLLWFHVYIRLNMINVHWDVIYNQPGICR